MQTAKSLQLMDDNGINISPITNIESIYYEVTENNVVYRKFLYDNFPVYTNFNATADEYSYVNTGNNPLEVGYYDTVKANVNSKLEDIIISSVTVNKLEGTAYNSLNIENYNLTKILYNYAPKYWVDTSIKNVLNVSLSNTIEEFHSSLDALAVTLNTSINNTISANNVKFSNINTSLNTLTNQVNDVSKYRLNVSTYSKANLTSYVNAKLLTPGKIYYLGYDPANDYFTTNLGGLSPTGQLYLGLIADTSSSFANKVVSCFNRNNSTFGNKHNWDINFDFTKYMITYLKDEYGNEAPYNFKQIKQKTGKYLFNNGSSDFSTSGKCLNNKIMTYDDIWFDVLYAGADAYIKNNYIAPGNSSIFISNNSSRNVENITINSSNSLIILRNIAGVNIGNNNVDVHISNTCNNTVMSNNNYVVIGNGFASDTAGNNIIENNCSSVKLRNCSNNIINSSCSNVSLYTCESVNIQQGCNEIINTHVMKNVLIMPRCNDITAYQHISNVVVGPNYTSLNITGSDTYYTYQRIIARSFEKF